MEGTKVKIISIPALRLYHIRGLNGVILCEEPFFGLNGPIYSVQVEGYKHPFAVRKQDLNFFNP